ncbi:MAG: hypothetical protein ACRDI2_24825, partial [Chloroflexota bacterium]
IWLPLVLCFVERSLRAPAPRRYTLAAFAGVALAMQALAVHVQVCVFTVLAVFPYLGWRVLFRDTIRAPLPGRLLIGTGLAMVLGLVAAGMSAVQVLPLLDMADRAARGHGISLEAATINSVTPYRLLTILFPHLLRRPDGVSFGYWVDWEVTVYVGVPTLFFAAVAILLRRDRYAVFFALLAGVSLVLAMGRYGPPWGVLVTRDLLGDHGLRSPGRFAFLWSFGMAALAGFGVDWLAGRRAGTGRLSRWSRLTFAVLSVALAGVAAGALLAVREARQWLMAHPDAARAWLDRHFVAFDSTAGLSATADEAYRNLVASLDPANPETAVWALSLLAGFVLLVAWFLVRAKSQLRPALRPLTVAVVALPLLSAVPVHPQAPMAAIEPNSGAAQFLRRRLASPDVSAGRRPLYRTYAAQPLYLDQADVEPNALLPLGIDEAGGYSSLSTESNLA